ncbi:MAG: hypothetical protein GY820_40595 [Gammaproteobacteria bacterium]|nr:hypothetical protein [Gammaproteobacteria bacterium]
MKHRPESRTIKYFTLILLSLAVSTGHADWAGLSASITEIESVWMLENSERNANITRLNLHLEERTSYGLGVGANLGQLTARLSNINSPLNTVKFDANYFGVYLRYPVQLGEHFALQGRLGYQYHSGTQYDTDAGDTIAWREVDFELGLASSFDIVRITPFIVYSDVSGDISSDTGTDTFSSGEAFSAGLSLDLFVEPTGFVRLRLTRGEQDAIAVVFAREY